MSATRISFRRAAAGSLTLVLVVVGLAAAWGVPGVADESTQIKNADTTFDNLEIVDSDLKGRLTVLRVGSDRQDGGLLSVFAGLKNNTDEALKIEVQTIYRDEFGQSVVNGKGSWIGMQLPPRSEATYRSAAITRAATDFLIRVRLDKS